MLCPYIIFTINFMRQFLTSFNFFVIIRKIEKIWRITKKVPKQIIETIKIKMMIWVWN